jgi:hypothetical protein
MRRAILKEVEQWRRVVLEKKIEQR